MTLSSLLGALPGAMSQGLIWGIMAIGVFITFKVLDIADLTVEDLMHEFEKASSEIFASDKALLG